MHDEPSKLCVALASYFLKLRTLTDAGFAATLQTVPQRLYDELAAKLSIVERRRAEDRDKLRELGRLREEADEWNRVREKTKARVVELVGEVKELKREVRPCPDALTLMSPKRT